MTIFGDTKIPPRQVVTKSVSVSLRLIMKIDLKKMTIKSTIYIQKYNGLWRYRIPPRQVVTKSVSVGLRLKILKRQKMSKMYVRKNITVFGATEYLLGKWLLSLYPGAYV